ncbi:MAG: hypothetical protein ACRDHW_10465, partial [Ktedonobacteraceae bacterium]
RYRAPAFRISSIHYEQLSHPHNSYLEIAAMGGLPVLILFLALLLAALWWTWRNWVQAEAQIRLLLAGGIAMVIALSLNSLGSNSWTLAPLATFGWLILGVVSSPLLTSKPLPSKPLQLLTEQQVNDQQAQRSHKLEKIQEQQQV